MQIREALELIYRLYSSFNHYNFYRNVGKDTYKIWKSFGKNIVIFLQKSSPDQRIPFWKWISELGVDNITKICEMYGIITAIHEKNDMLPPDLKNLYSETENIAVIIGMIDQKLREDLNIWAESVLTEEEISRNVETHVLSFTTSIKQNDTVQDTEQIRRAQRQARSAHVKQPRQAKSAQVKPPRQTRTAQLKITQVKAQRQAKSAQVKAQRQPRPARVARPVKTAPPLPQARISNADPRRKQVGPPPKQGGVRSLATIMKAFDRK